MEKLSKKELKTPDQVWQISRGLLDWMIDNFVVLLIVLAVAFAGLIGTVYYRQISLKKEGQAQFHYSLAKAHYEQWAIPGGKKDTPPAPGEAAKKTPPVDAEKAKADLQKELAVLEKDFPSSNANHMAFVFRAEMAEKDGKYGEAAGFYEKYLSMLKGSDRAIGLFPLAHAYENAAQYDKALASYDEILKIKDSPYTEWASLGRARTLRRLGKEADAEKAYTEFVEKFPNSAQAASARALSREKGEAVK